MKVLFCQFTPRYRTASIVAAVSMMLSGCNVGERLSQVGQAPDLTPISNPIADPEYQPVRLPMPAPEVVETHPNSLWRSGSRAFFRDQRASNIGDILTVLIEIDDNATLDNQSARSRDGSEDTNIGAIAGFESDLLDLLPTGAVLPDLTEFGSESSSSGEGSITRSEEIELKVAALVTQLLPNGNMAIYGRQEVRVNYEVRELEIAGVIRPEDISAQNTVSYEHIAEARISYGGRGHITDMQQPRYGQQIYDILFPF